MPCAHASTARLQGSAAPMVDARSTSASVGLSTNRSPDVVAEKSREQRRGRADGDGDDSRREARSGNATRARATRKTLLERFQRPVTAAIGKRPTTPVRKIRNPTCPAGFAFPSRLLSCGCAPRSSRSDLTRRFHAEGGI